MSHESSTVPNPDDIHRCNGLIKAQGNLWGLAHFVLNKPFSSEKICPFPASYFVYAYFLFDILVSDSDRFPFLNITKFRNNDDAPERRNKLLTAVAGELGDDINQLFLNNIETRRAQLDDALSNRQNRQSESSTETPAIHKAPPWEWLDRKENAPDVSGLRGDVSADQVNTFVATIRNLVQSKSTSPMNDIKCINTFIYKIRNRIVHGIKPWTMVHANKLQAKRFLLYTILIHATMDLVWEAIEQASVKAEACPET